LSAELSDGLTASLIQKILPFKPKALVPDLVSA